MNWPLKAVVLSAGPARTSRPATTITRTPAQVTKRVDSSPRNAPYISITMAATATNSSGQTAEISMAMFMFRAPSPIGPRD